MPEIEKMQKKYIFLWKEWGVAIIDGKTVQTKNNYIWRFILLSYQDWKMIKDD